jgi:hypothetical protein
VNVLREKRGIRKKASSAACYRVNGVYRVGRSGEWIGGQAGVGAVEGRVHNYDTPRAGAA